MGLLVDMGYGGSVTDVSKALVGGSGDGGLDGIIDQDHLGLDRIYVQAKRYAEGNRVGSGAIRDVFGSLDRYKATKGLFVTTSTFSSSARQTDEQLLGPFPPSGDGQDFSAAGATMVDQTLKAIAIAKTSNRLRRA
jgi:restriction endonuclease Mrr